MSGSRRQYRPAATDPVKSAMSPSPTIMNSSRSANGPPGFHTSLPPRIARDHAKHEDHRKERGAGDAEPAVQIGPSAATNVVCTS